MSKYDDLAKPIKPNAPCYNGNGFGILTYHHISLVKNWLPSHYQKYPNGKLPEQIIIKSKSK